MSSGRAESDSARRTRNRILRQAASISLAVSPFAAAFGILCAEADFGLGATVGFSTLVFGGSAQFAAATVLSQGGAVAAAVTAGALLNLRSTAFGIAMAPALSGPLWWRALVSQLMIDESTALGSSQTERRWQRFGFLAGGIGVFALWNAGTVVGYVVLGEAGSVITALGIDATIPASFLALLWPRLATPAHRNIAVVGAGVALLGTSFLPPGIPIVMSAAAIALLRPWRAGG